VPEDEDSNAVGVIGERGLFNWSLSRLDALYIKPTKQGNRSFITLEQLRSLDALHHHITAGGTMADFQTQLITIFNQFLEGEALKSQQSMG
jgi:hypothetical protein